MNTLAQIYLINVVPTGFHVVHRKHYVVLPCSIAADIRQIHGGGGWFAFIDSAIVLRDLEKCVAFL